MRSYAAWLWQKCATKPQTESVDKTMSKIIQKYRKVLHNERREMGAIVLNKVLASIGLGFGSILAIVFSPDSWMAGTVLFVVSILFSWITRGLSIWNRSFILLIILGNVLVIAFSNMQIMNELSLNFLGDWRYALKKKVAPDLGKELQLVLIDKKTQKHLGDDLRGYREYHGKVLGKLAEKGARVIGFNMIFSSQSPHDVIFADSLKALKDTRIIIPERYLFMTDSFVTTNRTIASAIQNNAGQVVHKTHDFLGTDSDGTVRTVALKKHEHLAFPLLVYLTYVDGELIPSRENVSYRTKNRELRTIPTGDETRMLINYTKNRFTAISYWDVFTGSTQSDFSGKIVLIGVVENSVATPGFPFPVRMSKVEIMANAIGTFLGDAYIKEVPRKIYLVFLLGLMMLNLSKFTRQMEIKPMRKVAAKSYLLQSSALIVTAIFAQILLNLWVDLSYPLLAIWLTFYMLRLYPRVASERNFKKIKLRLRYLGGTLIIILLTLCTGNQNVLGQENIGKIRKLTDANDKVIYQSANGKIYGEIYRADEFNKAYTGYRLQLQDAVETKKNGKAVLAIEQNAEEMLIIKINPDAKFKILDKNKWWLWKGNFLVCAKVAVRFSTEHGTASNEGTVFCMKITADAFSVVVLKGTVFLSNSVGTITIGANEFGVSKKDTPLKQGRVTGNVEQKIVKEFGDWPQEFRTDFDKVKRVNRLAYAAGRTRINTGSSTADIREPALEFGADAISGFGTVNIVVTRPQ